jgi:sec-independent protein translocase protein TatA
MFGIGRLEELLIVLALVLLFFGGKKLPELSKGLGDSIKQIRKGFKDDPDEKKEDKADDNHSEAAKKVS